MIIYGVTMNIHLEADIHVFTFECYRLWSYHEGL